MCSPIEDQPLRPSIGGVFTTALPVALFYMFYAPWIVLIYWPHILFIGLTVFCTFGFAVFLTDHPTQTNFTHHEFGVGLMCVVWTCVLARNWRKNTLMTLTSLLGIATILVFCVALPALYVEHPEHERPFTTLLNMLCSEQMTYKSELMGNLFCHTSECRRDKDAMGRPVIQD
jgi:hypothetical protein